MTVDATVRVMLWPNVRYSFHHSEVGNIKIFVTFPVNTDLVDVTVVTPIHTYELLDMPYGHSVHNLLMDNIRYSSDFLWDYDQGDCSKYPNL